MEVGHPNDSAPAGILTKLDKPVKVKITLVVSFDAESLDDISEIKETMDEAVDILATLGDVEEGECKEEILDIK